LTKKAPYLFFFKYSLNIIPLLRKLTRAGDPLAKTVFKEEIVKRISSRYFPVIKYLLEEDYLNYFTEGEFKILFDGYEFIKYEGEKIPIIQDVLSLKRKGIRNLSDVIGLNKLTSLQKLDLSYNQLTELPETIGKLTLFQKLDLSYNQLTELPETIGKLISLQELYLDSNQLIELPEAIGKLTALQELYLGCNQLTEEIIEKLKKKGVIVIII